MSDHTQVTIADFVTRERIDAFLGTQERDRARVCDTCGHRDGHHLTYCLKCPGRYVDSKETWRDSILRDPGNKNWVRNRLDCFTHAFRFGVVKRRFQYEFDAFRPEFDRIVMDLCGIDPSNP